MLKSRACDAMTGAGGSISRWGSEPRERNGLDKPDAGRCTPLGKSSRNTFQNWKTEVPPAGSGGDSSAKLVARPRSASSAGQLGRKAVNALTPKPDQSVGVDQAVTHPGRSQRG